jgi:hypothetical protein
LALFISHGPSPALKAMERPIFVFPLGPLDDYSTSSRDCLATQRRLQAGLLEGKNQTKRIFTRLNDRLCVSSYTPYGYS